LITPIATNRDLGARIVAQRPAAHKGGIWPAPAGGLLRYNQRMLARILRNLQYRHFSALAAEIVVVILGILIAFQIDSWADERRDRAEEREYLGRLVDDLQSEMGLMDDALRFARNRIASVRLLEKVAADPAAAVGRGAEVADALDSVTWRSYPQINAFVYSELQSTGKLSLIRSRELRDALAYHYTRLQHNSRVGTERDHHTAFDLRTAGILSTDEAIAIEDRNLGSDRLPIPDERAIEIARQLASRPEALAQLPNIAQHNEFNLRVLGESYERAAQLIVMIEAALSNR